MEMTGVCSICGGYAKPVYTCSLCGAMVCNKCFNNDLGLCRRCAAQARKGF
ncbi:MAG: orotate phosphoribosyltransferase [Candidatus Aenigmarchaeota archaeon]|nr:orotate phosphoribosyltransferase [Candidatus Aenigmarchaeota archaeon]